MREDLYEDIFGVEDTHWWFGARRRIVAAMLGRFAPRGRLLRIVDVGCGSGANLTMLEGFGRVVGLDPSPTALELCRRRALGAPLLAGALPDLPFAAETFDVVCALDVIEHIDDDRRAVDGLWRVCRPDGLLVVTVPAYEWLWSEHDDVNEHRRRYGRRQLHACISRPNAELLRLTFTHAMVTPAVVLFHLARALTRRAGIATGPPRSNLFRVPARLNALLESMCSLEAVWIRRGRLPFGTSLLCVARKRGASLGLPAGPVRHQST
jgi:SAM-dependent methyltransferase